VQLGHRWRVCRCTTRCGVVRISADWGACFDNAWLKSVPRLTKARICIPYRIQLFHRYHFDWKRLLQGRHCVRTNRESCRAPLLQPCVSSSFIPNTAIIRNDRLEEQSGERRKRNVEASCALSIGRDAL